MLESLFKKIAGPQGLFLLYLGVIKDIAMNRAFLHAKKHPCTDAQPEIFQGRGGFAELKHSDKNFAKNTRQKELAWNILEFFLLDILKTTF